MNKTVRYILYVVIIAICIMAIFIGVYSFIFRNSEPDKSEVNPETNTIINNTLAETKDAFKDLFANQFFGNNYDSTNIQKVVEDKPIVYEALTVEKVVEGMYSINAHIPGININTEVAKGYNQITATNIIKKINEIQKAAEEAEKNNNSQNATTNNLNGSAPNSNSIGYTANNVNEGTIGNNANNISGNTIGSSSNQLNNTIDENTLNEVNGEELNTTENKSTSNYTVCNVSFTGYINNNILSVAMLITLKEGNNPQKTMVQTYNYNLKTGQDVKISEILQNRGLDFNAVNKKIKNEIKQVAEQAKSVSQSGYNVYQRDPDSDIYNVVNSDTFIQGPNGELYIIYAYGNTDYTSEMDIIQI